MRPASVKTSVITLTHDRPEWLEETIRSVEAQTDQDYEHVVCDRASRDGRVGEVLREAVRRRPEKFRFFRFSGVGPEVVGFYWNLLLDYARGRYVTILDDDNRKRSTFLEDMTALMEADETIEATSCGWSVIDGAGKLTGEDRHWNKSTSLVNLYRTNTIDSNAMVFRRSVLDKIGRFDPEITTNEDWHFVIRLVRSCRIVHLDECLLEYRVHDSARSRQALELGAHANWQRIRDELFTKEEAREAIRRAQAMGGG